LYLEHPFESSNLIMSATAAASILPIVDRRALTASEANLVSLLRNKASWIWTTEESVPAPTAPVNVQRAFRKTFPLSSSSTPSNVTILVAADDYFAMYVNGVLVQAADTSHDYHNILAFNVPLPAVKGESTSSVVLAFRVINKTDKAGLLAAVQVNYEGVQAPDQFYTGIDQTWLGEALYPEHWEQPWFDSTPQASSWRPAQVLNSSQIDPAMPTLVRQEVVVMGALSPETGNIPQPGSAPTPTADSCVGSNCSHSHITLSKGGFAGVLVGSILFAIAIASVVSFLLTRRRYRRRMAMDDASVFWGVAPQPQVSETQPTTKPGKTQMHMGPVILG
jgi:hypothetical protein